MPQFDVESETPGLPGSRFRFHPHGFPSTQKGPADRGNRLVYIAQGMNGNVFCGLLQTCATSISPTKHSKKPR